MDNIENLPQDAGIAMILQRLKDSAPAQKDKSSDSAEAKQEDNKTPTLIVPATEISVSSIPKPQPVELQSVNTPSVPKEVIDRKEDPQVPEYIAEKDMTEESILPWFLESDKDQKMIHYITFNDNGGIEFNTVKTDWLAKDLASLKMKDNFACDIDYYKSRHFVLYVKQFDSDYSYSRSFSKLDESKKSITEADNSNPVLLKTPTEDVSMMVAASEKYFHFVVFTDLGVADFIAKQDDISFPFGEPNLSKWFEEISNQVPLKCTEYSPVSDNLSEAVESIRDFNYDIITMHIPGVITLDSVDNDDQDYQVHIRLKDEFSFLPMSRILKCLRYYANHEDKSYGDFRRFINHYFEVVS